MPGKYKVAVIVGSLRKNGCSVRLAAALAEMAPEHLVLHQVPIGDLPLFNQDDEASPPASYGSFRRAIAESAAVLFVTPEYNRSIPGGLKNALDVGSRPYGQNVFDGKAAAIVSQTHGATGAFGANHAIRQVLVFLNMPTLQQPEAYIAHSDKLFAENGTLINDGTRAFLTTFMKTFADWIALNTKHPPT
jgi:chromate reductase